MPHKTRKLRARPRAGRKPYAILKSKEMKMRLDARTGTLILSAVAMLLIIFIAAFALKSTPATAPSGSTGPTGPTSNPPVAAVYAPQGQVVAGFPKEFILDTAARVANSYSLNYSSGNGQYTAVWMSSSTVASIFSQYKTYLTANGWTIPKNGAVSGKYGAGIFANKTSSTVNISIVPQGKGSQATISYLSK